MQFENSARRGQFAALLIASITALLIAFSSGPAHAATSCPAPTFPGNGSFTGVSVAKATCSEAGKVILGFQACRTKTGPTGRCVSKVSGYACQEIRTNQPTFVTSTVKCAKTKTKKVKKKKKKTKYVVSFGYTQNL